VSRRVPPTRERVALLKTRGWVRISAYGSQSWWHPRYGRAHRYTLAAAWQAETNGASTPEP
jgi:hypothetical protein